jgi:hypothetical protein
VASVTVSAIAHGLCAGFQFESAVESIAQA